MSGVRQGVFFLVGLTAAGKTDTAHELGLRLGAWILSADAMSVYRGMDIGTAKPRTEQRAQLPYYGLDLISPAESFSLGAYVRHAAGVLRRARLEKRAVLVVGGTGLYVRALMQGLAPLPPADPVWRAEAEALLRNGGMDALRERVRFEAPEAYAAVRDPDNPRRLIRLVEKARAGPPPAAWAAVPQAVLAGLRWPREELDLRIVQRVKDMFRDGLLEEARALRAAGPLASAPAGAIGYAEAFDVLDGRCTPDEAVRRTAQRTRRLARRQETWWRRQAKVAWIESMERPDEAADRILDLWRKHGPTPVAY